MSSKEKGRLVLPLILLLFAFSILFWISVMMMLDIFFLLFFIALILILILSVLYIRAGESPRKVIGSIAVGILLCILTYLAFIVITAGPIIESSHLHYRVTIQGLENYQGGLVTTIIIPLPYWQGKPAFSDEDLINKSFGSWSSLMVMTDDGKMLAFQTLEENLTDIEADFLKYYDPSYPMGESFRGAFLPESKENGGQYTSWIYGLGVGEGPSTIIFIDDSIQPEGSENATVSANIEFYRGGGRFFGIESDTYRMSIKEELPGGIRGSIPVITQLGKLIRGSSGLEWMPL